jgi:SET domain-containing protein
MLLVKTKIGPSSIEGIGLFADEFIPKGTFVWKFAPGFDMAVKPERLQELSAPSREQFLKYAYMNMTTGEWILCVDDARFFNHSDTPNTTHRNLAQDSNGDDFANRDIQIGEELTTDYRSFDAGSAQKLTY